MHLVLWCWNWNFSQFQKERLHSLFSRQTGIAWHGVVATHNKRSRHIEIHRLQNRIGTIWTLIEPPVVAKCLYARFWTRAPVESPGLNKMSDSTYVLGMEEAESSSRHEDLSLTSDRNNIGEGNHVSVDSASLRSPVDSMLGDDHHQLLGSHLSTVPVVVNSNWGSRPRNLSSKSSSSTRRYSHEGGGSAVVVPVHMIAMIITVL